MGRAILYKPADTSGGGNILGMHYEQVNGPVRSSDQENGTWGNLGNNADHIKPVSGSDGYTIKETGSILHLRMNASQDHGTTWRSGCLRMKSSGNNWSSSDVVGSIMHTSWSANGNHAFGDSGCYERFWEHDQSVGTTIRFGWQDSSHSSGRTWAYNCFNQESDGYGGGNGNTTFGNQWGMGLRVVEYKSSAISQMSSQSGMGPN